jgi:uncharacterized protein (TIRG00374 family)
LTYASVVALLGVSALGSRALSAFGVREAVEQLAREAGPWGPAALFGLMVVQAVPTPVPTTAITLVAGLLYGVVFGTAVAWSGAMVASAVSFGLGRWLGRLAVARLGGRKALAYVDTWSSNGAFRAVLVARLMPTMSFRATSLVAGLLPMRLSAYLVATGVGQLPATVAYAALGASLVGDASGIVWAAGGVGAIAGAVWLARAWTTTSADRRERATARAAVLITSLPFRIGAGVVILSVICWRLGVQQIGDALRQADLVWLGAGVAATVGALMVSAWKWQLLLRAAGVDAPFRSLFGAYLIGQFFNNVLPSNVGGDVARAQIIGSAIGSRATVTGTIVGERLIAGLALVATALGALAVSPWLVGTVGVSVAITGIVFVCVTSAFAVPHLRRRAIDVIGTEGKRGAVSRVVEGLGATLAHPFVVISVFALSIVFQGMVIAVAWFGFRAVGADVPLAATIALIPIISAVQLAPVSVGGLGVREGAYAALFGACCAVPAPVAVAASLTFGLIVGFVSLAGGVRFAMEGHTSARSAFPEAPELAEVIRRVERETWLDADWLWTFVEGMRAAGRTPEETIAAIRRQGDANRLPARKQLVRRVQLLRRSLDPRRLSGG